MNFNITLKGRIRTKEKQNPHLLSRLNSPPGPFPPGRLKPPLRPRNPRPSRRSRAESPAAPGTLRERPERRSRLPARPRPRLVRSGPAMAGDGEEALAAFVALHGAALHASRVPTQYWESLSRKLRGEVGERRWGRSRTGERR